MLRVEEVSWTDEQHLLQERTVVLGVLALQLPALPCGAVEHFAVPVQHGKVGVRLAPKDALHERWVVFAQVYQHGYGINGEELRHAQLIPIDADLIHLQVDLGDFDALVSQVQPDVRRLPVVDGIDGVRAGDALCAHI